MQRRKRARLSSSARKHASRPSRHIARCFQFGGWSPRRRPRVRCGLSVRMPRRFASRLRPLLPNAKRRQPSRTRVRHTFGACGTRERMGDSARLRSAAKRGLRAVIQTSFRSFQPKVCQRRSRRVWRIGRTPGTSIMTTRPFAAGQNDDPRASQPRQGFQLPGSDSASSM
jgi:hypothetical protein